MSVDAVLREYMSPLMKPTPMLEVNGQRTQLMSPYMPWSSEWGLHPAVDSGQ